MTAAGCESRTSTVAYDDGGMQNGAADEEREEKLCVSGVEAVGSSLGNSLARARSRRRRKTICQSVVKARAAPFEPEFAE